jgi:putative peptidoglycan lipid II flippase
MLRQLLGEGAVSSAVVPVLSERLASGGDAAAQSFFARTRGVSIVALAIATVVGISFARPLCVLFAGGYRARPEQFERVVLQTRLVFPYIFFMGTAALGMAALNSKRRFAVAAFAPGLLNVAFLVCAFALPPLLASRGIDTAHAMVAGALLGGVLQVAAQWPALRAIGFAQRPVLDLKDPSVREVLRRIAPMTFGIGVYYIDLILARRFLSELGTGAQSHFTWASRICDLPQGLFVMALSTAALPALSTLAAKGDRVELAMTFAHGLRLALFVAIPASVALVFLANPIVVLMFQRGAFDAVAAAETARALAWQGGAIWTVSIVRQIVPVFYALGDTRTPVLVSVLDLVVFIVLAVTLRGSMGHVGISIAVAGSSFAQMALLVLALRRLLGSAFGAITARVLASFARSLMASLVGASGAFVVARLLAPTHLADGYARALPGVASMCAFGAIFLVTSSGLSSPEISLIAGGIRRRLRRNRKP